MYDPMVSYYLAANKQRDLIYEDPFDQQAEADAADLVERVLADVWKRLGLPARDLGSRAISGIEPSLFSKEVPG